MTNINKIDRDNLCLGCGLCESICGKSNVTMILKNDGFYHPNVTASNKQNDLIIYKVCPGINIDNDLKFKNKQSIWGKIIKTYSGYANDCNIRRASSSGGVISALAIYLIENSIVDAILQIGADKENYENNILRISRTKEDVLNCSSSRYAPALVFNSIIEILNSSDDVYCFIGKPCDISTLKNLTRHYPQYKNRFHLIISIFCAGMPSFNGTKTIINEMGAKLPVSNLIYRGNGWPGNFSFIDNNNEFFTKSYNETWGKTLNKHLNFRCKICPDGIGLQADITVGDAWETIDGYPDFTEKEGKSLIIVRTQIGLDELKNAEINSNISLEDLEFDRIATMQPYQYARRLNFGARILAFVLIKRRKLHFKNTRIINNLLKASTKEIIYEFLGTMKRLLK